MSRSGTHELLTVLRIARLFLVPTTLNSENTFSLVISDCTLVTVWLALYASSLSIRLILYFFPAMATPPWAFTYWKYDFSPLRMAVNAEYGPDSGRLVPMVMVSPFTPTESFPAGQADVSTTLAGPLLGPLPPLVVGVTVFRDLPHAAATSTAARSSATRRNFIGRVLPCCEQSHRCRLGCAA